jgi:hypothetical protein
MYGRAIDEDDRARTSRPVRACVPGLRWRAVMLLGRDLSQRVDIVVGLGLVDDGVGDTLAYPNARPDLAATGCRPGLGRVLRVYLAVVHKASAVVLGHGVDGEKRRADRFAASSLALS